MVKRVILQNWVKKCKEIFEAETSEKTQFLYGKLLWIPSWTFMFDNRFNKSRNVKELCEIFEIPSVILTTKGAENRNNNRVFCVKLLKGIEKL